MIEYSMFINKPDISVLPLCICFLITYLSKKIFPSTSPHKQSQIHHTAVLHVLCGGSLISYCRSDYHSRGASEKKIMCPTTVKILNLQVYVVETQLYATWVVVTHISQG